jgi:putative ABC transport system permease protein
LRLGIDILAVEAKNSAMQTLIQDLRYAFRTLIKSPGFTVVAVLTLALAIGANTAIFSVVQNVLLRPLPYPEPQSLVEIFNTYLPQVPHGGLSPGDYADWREQAKSFSAMEAYAHVSQGLNLTGDGEPQRVQVAYVSAGLFRLLGASEAAGRFFVPEEDRAGHAPVMVLSHRLWQSRFGADRHVVGHAIALDNQRYTIVGVLPASFEMLRWADVWMPLGQYNDDLTEHVHHAFLAIARLTQGFSLAQAREEINALNRMEAAAYPDAHKNFGVVVQPLEDPAAAKLRGTLLVLFSAVGLVLLIACANIMNLLLVRNAGREREISLRTALGADSWRLLRQLLTESSMLALAGGALGLILAFAGLKVLMVFVPSDLEVLQRTSLNGWVLAFTLAVCIATGMVCGAVPALRTLRTDIAGALKQGSKGTSSLAHQRTHKLLVISEIGMAILPLIGAGLLLRSLQHLLLVDPGFRPDHVLTIEVQQAGIPFAQYSKLSQEEQIKLGEAQSLKFEEIAAQIRALPGVKEAGGIDDLPLGNELRQASRFVIEGQPLIAAGARPIAQTRTVSLSYFAAAGIPLRAGRTFTQDDWKAFSAVVINEAMARRYWPKGDALGKRINLCSLDPKPCWLAIIGIVGNVHQFGLEADPTYDTYFVGGWTPYLVIRSSTEPATLAPAIIGMLHRTEPDLPISRVITMDGLISDSVSPRRFSAVLIGFFAGLALVLAAVGIYGVMSNTVSGRRQEIGIRMALGAQPGDVKTMILAESARLTLIGVVGGLAAAFVLVRFLASLIFGVSTYDWVTFGGVALLLSGVALGASYIPARRAVRVDPIVALRYE